LVVVVDKPELVVSPVRFPTTPVSPNTLVTPPAGPVGPVAPVAPIPPDVTKQYMLVGDAEMVNVAVFAAAVVKPMFVGVVPAES